VQEGIDDAGAGPAERPAQVGLGQQTSVTSQGEQKVGWQALAGQDPHSVLSRVAPPAKSVPRSESDSLRTVSRWSEIF